MDINEKNELKVDKILNELDTSMYGWVQIFETEESFKKRKPDFEGKNKIVATGRSFNAQRIFGDNLTYGGGRTPLNLTNYSLTHFAIGGGGAVVDGQVASILGSNIEDQYLSLPIGLGNESYLNEPSKYVSEGQSPLVNTYLNAVKPIRNKEDPEKGDIYLEYVRYESAQTYPTKLRCYCVIPPGEPANLLPGTSIQVSEAALYITNPTLTDVRMFARICFAPKWVELENPFRIFWYIVN